MDRIPASFWLLLLAVPALAGCVGDEEVAPVLSALRVESTALQADTAYLLHHDGGSLEFTVTDGEAAFVLFDPHDRRLGETGLGPSYFRRSLYMEDMAAGDYVMVMRVMNGTLQVLSDGELVTSFEELGSHFDRVVIAEAPLEPDPTFGVLSALGAGTGDPINATTEVALFRTPIRMHLLAGGQATDILVTVQGDGGTVLTLDSFGYSTGGPTGSVLYIEPVGGTFEPRNVRGEHYQAQVQAEEFSGVLILESWSYSRHLPTPHASAMPSSDEVAFVYGELPARPVAFEVHERARSLYFGAPNATHTTNATNANDCGEEDCGETPDSWVSLYDPTDRKLGTYRVPAGGLVRVPIDGPGEYVAVAKHGPIVLGADRVPVDFELRVLDIEETVGPTEPAGNSTEYGQRSGQMTVVGVPYGLQPEYTSPEGEQVGPFEVPSDFICIECSTEGTLRILDGGETLGFWGEDVPDGSWRADLFLQPGPIQFLQDGAGGESGHIAMRVFSYLR